MNKKLYDALRKLVKDGHSFNFGYIPVPKGTEFEIDKGLNETMESDLQDWITEELAPKSEYHSTDYKLTFIDNQIHLDCYATWGDWPDEDPYSSDDLLTDGILKILLPKHDFNDIDLECLSISFECTIDESKAEFFWHDEHATYEDEETTIDIPIKPIKLELETEFKKILSDFESNCPIDQEGSIVKTISVDCSHTTVTGCMNFQLTISLEDD